LLLLDIAFIDVPDDAPRAQDDMEVAYEVTGMMFVIIGSENPMSA
jgi:hypothetical protein